MTDLFHVLVRSALVAAPLALLACADEVPGQPANESLDLAALDERYLPAEKAADYVVLSPDQAQDGFIHVDGDVTSEGTFRGDGSGLTGLDASRITTGTLAQERLPLSALDERYAHVSGVASVALSPDQAQTGFIHVDGDVTSEGTFHGDGAGLTGLNASQLTAGTLAQERLPWSALDQRYAPVSGVANYVALSPDQAQQGFIHVDGDITSGGTFHGDGAGLTGLNASRITAGTLAQERLPLSALDERYAPASANYVALSPAQAQQGFVHIEGDVTTGGGFHGDGGGLTGLNASQITAGTLAQERLPGTIDRALTLSNEGNAFTGALVGKVLLPREASAVIACDANAVGATYLNTSVGVVYVCTDQGWTPLGEQSPRLAWTSGSLDFGEVGPTAEEKTATLKNVGREDAFDIALDVPEGLALEATTCDLLAAGESCTATFRPLLEGTAGTRRFLITATSANASSVTLVGEADYQAKGSSAYPGRSCYDIKRQHPAAPNGKYWIDPDGAGAIAPRQVVCNMSVDGGGWTFFAYQSASTRPDDIFGANVGSYSTSGDTGLSYSIGGDLLPNIPHSQMMVALDSSNPQTAQSNGKLVFFQYAVAHPAFNSGPLPCANLTLRTQLFFYRVQEAGPFLPGHTANCTATRWGPLTPGEEPFPLVTFDSSQNGVQWGRGMAEERPGYDGWGKHSFWFVREAKP